MINNNRFAENKGNFRASSQVILFHRWRNRDSEMWAVSGDITACRQTALQLRSLHFLPSFFQIHQWVISWHLQAFQNSRRNFSLKTCFCIIVNKVITIILLCFRLSFIQYLQMDMFLFATYLHATWKFNTNIQFLFPLLISFFFFQVKNHLQHASQDKIVMPKKKKRKS